MHKANQLAVDVLKVVAEKNCTTSDLIAVVAAFGGTSEDLEKVMILDEIYKANNGRKQA